MFRLLLEIQKNNKVIAFLFFQTMMGWWSSKCACVKGRRRPVINDEYSESDTKSVSEIELRTSSAPDKKIGVANGNSCCKIKRHIPRTILRWFGQDDEMSMTKIEKVSLFMILKS